MEKKAAAAAASPCAEPEAFLPEPALEKPLNDSSVIDDSLNSTSDNMASVHSSSEKGKPCTPPNPQPGGDAIPYSVNFNTEVANSGFI